MLPDGRRFPVKGLEGDSLANVLHRHEDIFGQEGASHSAGQPSPRRGSRRQALTGVRLPAVICLSPEGRNEVEAHVQLPNELLAGLPALQDLQQRHLREIAVDPTPRSALLACSWSQPDAAASVQQVQTHGACRPCCLAGCLPNWLPCCPRILRPSKLGSACAAPGWRASYP